MKGVDVSFHNGVVDWKALKDAGIKFAICRTGYGKNGFKITATGDADNILIRWCTALQ